MSLTEAQDFRFVRERREGWQRLSELLDEAQRMGLGGLTGEDVLELGRLYRRTAADLAYARTHLPDESLIRRLNDLVGRAHGYVYVSERSGARGLLDFFWREFPEVLVRYRTFVFIATAVFVLGAAVPFLRPDLQDFLIDPSYTTPYISSSDSPEAGSYITQNNIRVALMAFAAGITWGLLTIFILFNNGMHIGAVGPLIASKGESAKFWPSIAPHGVLELTAIMIAGGAGLMLGWALLHPGDLPRGRALSQAAGDAVRLLAGTIPMFLVAGAIEGFISFTDLPAWVKLTVSALSAVAMGFYFTRKNLPSRIEDRG